MNALGCDRGHSSFLACWFPSELVLFAEGLVPTPHAHIPRHWLASPGFGWDEPLIVRFGAVMGVGALSSRAGVRVVAEPSLA